MTAQPGREASPSSDWTGDPPQAYPACPRARQHHLMERCGGCGFPSTAGRRATPEDGCPACDSVEWHTAGGDARRCHECGTVYAGRKATVEPDPTPWEHWHGERYCDRQDCAGREASLDDLCRVMHDAYETEAARVGWATQQASRVRWEDVPEPNKAAMRAAVRALLAVTPPAREST